MKATATNARGGAIISSLPGKTYFKNESSHQEGAMNEKNEPKEAPPAKSLDEIYSDRTLYTSSDLFAPIVERLPTTLMLELTEGCSWMKCSYCTGYKGIRHRIKSPDEYKAHVDAVWKRIGNRSRLASGLERVFIGGGNALEVETEALRDAILYTMLRFAEHTPRDRDMREMLLSGRKPFYDKGYTPERVSLYGRTENILQHGIEGLMKLRYIVPTTGPTRDIIGREYYEQYQVRSFVGLDMIYWGVESGSSQVLEYVNKGCTSQRDIITAGRYLKEADIASAVMILPGLGGARFYEEHIAETAKILGWIKPNSITFMGVTPAPNSRYARKMQQEQEEGTNRSLTERELAAQMINIIAKMPFFKTTLACFDAKTDAVGSNNPLAFGIADIPLQKVKDKFVERLIQLYSMRRFEDGK